MSSMTLEHDKKSTTDGRLSRRNWLQVGAVGGLGLQISSLLARRAQAARASGESRESPIRSCIMIFYYGGPSHIDTFDMKPDAPSEIRGEFKSIATSAPGIRVSEHLPHMAKFMHKVAVVRTLHHELATHDAASANVLTGRPPLLGDVANVREDAHTFPSLGASLTHMWSHKRLAVYHAALPFVMVNNFQNPGQTPGFLGPACSPFLIKGRPNTLDYEAGALSLPSGLTATRLGERRGLLSAFEGLSRHSQSAASLWPFRRKAFELMAADGIRKALDIRQEDMKVRERYGLGPVERPDNDSREPPEIGPSKAFARELRGQNLLLARRLVEAGVPFVSVYDYLQQGHNWDSHGKNFLVLRRYLLPAADRALAALIEDLDARGLLDTTLVVALGEFGRTPKINKNAGRDHWPACGTVLFAGGGVKGGFLYGASDRNGAYPAADPVTPGDLAATILSRFGLDPASEIVDRGGRPWRLAEGDPIHELFT